MVQIAAVCATSLNQSRSSNPATTLSWFPRITASQFWRVHCTTSRGRGLYPTISPQHSTFSYWFSASFNTDCSAHQLAWRSLRTRNFTSVLYRSSTEGRLAESCQPENFPLGPVKCKTMSLVVIGSVAYDAIET